MVTKMCCTRTTWWTLPMRLCSCWIRTRTGVCSRSPWWSTVPVFAWDICAPGSGCPYAPRVFSLATPNSTDRKQTCQLYYCCVYLFLNCCTPSSPTRGISSVVRRAIYQCYTLCTHSLKDVISWPIIYYRYCILRRHNQNFIIVKLVVEQ